jgi:hypothetical protein
VSEDEIDAELSRILARHFRDIGDSGGRPTSDYLADMRALIAAQADNAVHAALSEPQDGTSAASGTSPSTVSPKPPATRSGTRRKAS